MLIRPPKVESCPLKKTLVLFSIDLILGILGIIGILGNTKMIQLYLLGHLQFDILVREQLLVVLGPTRRHVCLERVITWHIFELHERQLYNMCFFCLIQNQILQILLLHLSVRLSLFLFYQHLVLHVSHLKDNMSENFFSPNERCSNIFWSKIFVFLQSITLSDLVKNLFLFGFYSCFALPSCVLPQTESSPFRVSLAFESGSPGEIKCFAKKCQSPHIRLFHISCFDSFAKEKVVLTSLTLWASSLAFCSIVSFLIRSVFCFCCATSCLVHSILTSLVFF